MGKYNRFTGLAAALILIASPAIAAPDNSFSLTTATTNTTISSTDNNNNLNELSTKYVAHDHTDITKTTANIFSIGDAAAGNKQLTFDNAAATDANFRWDGLQLQFAPDGSTYSTLNMTSGATATHYQFPATPTTGDVLYSDGQLWTGLNASSNTDHVLRSAGATTAPSWQISPVEDQFTAAGEILYGDAANSMAILASGTAGQNLISNGAAAPSWGSAQFDPSLILEFYDDFETNLADTSGDFRSIHSRYDWVISGGDVGVSQGAGGIWDLTSNGTQNAVFFLADITSTITVADAAEPFQTSKNPTVIFRFRAEGAEATRSDFIGLSNAALDGAEPATGVWLTWAEGGNISITADDGTKETDDTGVDIDTGVSWHTMKMVFSGGNAVAWDLNNGTATGTLTTNVPSDTFTFTYTLSPVGDGKGIKLDYVYVRQTR